MKRIWLTTETESKENQTMKRIWPNKETELKEKN